MSLRTGDGTVLRNVPIRSEEERQRQVFRYTRAISLPTGTSTPDSAKSSFHPCPPSPDAAHARDLDADVDVNEFRVVIAALLSMKTDVDMQCPDNVLYRKLRETSSSVKQYLAIRNTKRRSESRRPRGLCMLPRQY